MKLVNVELELNKSPYEVNFIDVTYSEVNELYAAIEDPAPPSTNF